MSEWKEFRLSEIMDIIGGGTPKTSISEYWGGDIPWLSVVDFGNGNKFVKKTEKNITELGLKNSSTKILKSGQIIISARGTVGELAMLKGDMAFNQSCYGLNAKKDICSNNFLYYLLKIKISELKSNAHGAVFDTITRSTFETINVLIPSLEKQSIISEILSSLDDKIELNNKINQELESLAQTLFKQWFIDFEFPNENGEPYKSSGGEMVDSELGEIPKGWLIGNFGDLVIISSGKGINKKNYQANGDYPIIGANGIMGNYDSFNIEGFKILTGRVGTLGTVRISNEKAWTSDNVLICEPLKMELGHYSYFVMKDFDYKSLNRGSTQPLLTQTDLKSQTVIIPRTNILLQFQNQMDIFLSMIELNKSELKELTTLRNTLLPKLISGELEINEISN